MIQLISELMRTESIRRHDIQPIIFNYGIINTKFAAGRGRELQALYYLQLFDYFQK
jgi:hypothetical protein